MDGFLEFFGCVLIFILFAGLLSFWDNPEETMNRLGRCIAAFRRGLAGQSLDNKASESQSDALRD